MDTYIRIAESPSAAQNTSEGIVATGKVATTQNLPCAIRSFNRYGDDP